MVEKPHFKKGFNIEPTAATIGINSDEWYCYLPGMNREEIIKTMMNKKYDIVPIINKQGILKNYFTIDAFDISLKVNEIKKEDCIYYLTHVRDIIWIMQKQNRSHFFLSNNRSKNDIIGLISLSNLNCREFYVYLFNLISYVEREFSELINITEVEGFLELERLSNNENLMQQLQSITERITVDKQNNNENNYKEYLYLHHLIWLVKAEGKYKKLKYKDAEAFQAGTSVLKELRNNIAHPVKSLVRNFADLYNLEKAMNKLYEFKERLDDYLK